MCFRFSKTEIARENAHVTASKRQRNSDTDSASADPTEGGGGEEGTAAG